MRFSRMITVVGAHACGELNEVITGGVRDVPGRTMFEKMQYVEQHADDLRQFLLNEPRGKVNQCVNLVLPPTRPEADAGFVIIECDYYVPMSGTNTICTVTVAARNRHDPDAGAGHRARARSAGRPGPGHGRLPRRQVRERHLRQRAGLRLRARAEVDVPGLGRIGPMSPMAG